MKSFNEYIEESYNFRLGGSQQKGFEQNKPLKTFAELEEGDKMYYARIFQNKLDGADAYNVIETKKETDVLKIIYASGWAREIPIDKANDSVYVYDFVNNSSKYVVATNEVEFLEKIEELSGTKNAKIKDYTTIKEAYNFRLGGSQKKGFDQNKHKTFGDLEEGDFIYRFNPLNRTAYKLKFISLDGPRENCFMINAVNSRGFSKQFYFNAKSLDESVMISAKTCIATSEEEFIDTMASKFNIKIKSKDIV